MSVLVLAALLLGAALLPAAEPPITALALTPDGTAVVVGSQSGLERRRWPGLERDRQVAADMDHIHALAFSPDGQLLAVAGGSPAVAGVVQLHAMPALDQVARVHPHQDLIYDVAWSADGRHLATAGADRRVLVLERSSLRTEAELAGHSGPVLAVVSLATGHWVTAGVDQTLRVWEPGRTMAAFALNNHQQAVLGLSAAREGDRQPSLPQVVSVGADRTLRLWQPTIGRLVRFVTLESIPQAVCWTGDGAVVAAACRDGRVRLVDCDTATLVATLPALDGVAYCIATAPDGSLVVGGQDAELVRVEVPGGKGPAR